MGVELAARGEVETLAIFHHDPAFSDKDMDDFLAHTKKFLDRSKLAVREATPGIPGHLLHGLIQRSSSGLRRLNI